MMGRQAWHSGPLGVFLIFALSVLATVAPTRSFAQTPALAQTPGRGGGDLPILLSADEVNYDRDLGVTTAKGKVEVSHDDRILLADTVSYHEGQDVLTASGNISLLEPDGTVVFANYMELTGDMKVEIIRDLRMVLSDSSRVAAAGARRSGGTRLEMRNSVYSPCRPCAEDPERAPLWQVKAIKVVHDAEAKTIVYNDAWLEIVGVPVAYTPYLTHPDPTVKRRTGLLAPQFGGSNDLGFIFKMPVFFDIAPDRDLTLTPWYTSNKGPVAEAEYRQLFTNGKLDIAGSLTQDAGNDVRGHVKARARADFNDTWRGGVDVARASDDTYMRRYGFQSESTLTSRVFTEGFRQRNFATADLYAFQGLHKDADAGTTPYVLPLARFSHQGSPNKYGARSALDGGIMVLNRTDANSTRRLTARAGWDLPVTTDTGDAFMFAASVRGNGYHVSQLARADTGSEYSGAAARIRPELSAQWRHPLIRTQPKTYQLLEPIVQAVYSPNGGNSTKIPNEDSQDLEFDHTNLFNTNRFTGTDRVEGGFRTTYGMRWGVFGAGGGSSTVMIGQSYRPRRDDTFATGSGLEGKFSDLVGNIEVAPGKYLNLGYRTRINKDDFSPRRNEISISSGARALNFSANYVYFDRQEGSEYAGREELNYAASAQLTRFWKGSFSATQDLGEDDSLRRLGIGLSYEDECLIFATNLTRTFYKDRDLRPADSILFSVTFKTLGEVSSGLSQFQ